MTEPSRQEQLRHELRELGFDDVRFAAVTMPLANQNLGAWLQAGMQGDMAWMDRTAEKRLNPELVLPGVRSIIMLGVSYAADRPVPRPAASRPGGGAEIPAEKPIWARYAVHDDYHDTIEPALVAAGRILEERYDVGGKDYRYYVDTGPVLERSWAARAGIGFIGKNAMLISRRHGNWMLLAALLTRIEFLPDEPLRKHRPTSTDPKGAAVGLLCGKCTRCLDACPTQAFPRPGVVDARRCISYQTIENKGTIPRYLRAGIGARIFGCDVCLEVCPWNRFARRGREMLIRSRTELAGLGLREILELTPARFTELFRRTPIKRVKLQGLLRNACVVAGNSADPSLFPTLVGLAEHDSALVRAHAVWAVFRLAGPAEATSLLRQAREEERDAAVLAEYDAQ